MAPRRRRVTEEEETPALIQTQRRRRRDDTPEEDEDVDMEEETQRDQGSGSVEQLAKGLVRYALSCEHSRKPIKRQDINEKGDDDVNTVLISANNYSARFTYSPVQGCIRASPE
jgi:hypothetical protein